MDRSVAWVAEPDHIERLAVVVVVAVRLAACSAHGALSPHEATVPDRVAGKIVRSIPLGAGIQIASLGP
jgi:hypothetical protein